MTDALFSAFQLASGDNHPIHYDRPYCQARGHKDMLAHGNQVLIQACAGAGVLPHHMGDALIGFLEQSSRFLAPVYVGDTLYPMLEIAELRPGRTTGTMRVALTIHNQDGVCVLDTTCVELRPIGCRASVADGVLRFKYAGPEQQLHEVFAVLTRHEVSFRGVRRDEEDLESIFMRLTRGEVA